MRIIRNIEIEKQSTTALFDTGAFNTYVKRHLTSNIPKIPVEESYKVALGGKTIVVNELCILRGRIEGLSFDTEAIPVDDIGKVDGYELDSIIGALTMEKWEIKIDLRNNTLDLSGLRRREFTEF